MNHQQAHLYIGALRDSDEFNFKLYCDTEQKLLQGGPGSRHAVIRYIPGQYHKFVLIVHTCIVTQFEFLYYGNSNYVMSGVMYNVGPTGVTAE